MYPDFDSAEMISRGWGGVPVTAGPEAGSAGPEGPVETEIFREAGPKARLILELLEAIRVAGLTGLLESAGPPAF